VIFKAQLTICLISFVYVLECILPALNLNLNQSDWDTNQKDNGSTWLLFNISADADGGPRSRVRTAGHSAQPPIDFSGNFSVHVSAE
jgi:hypothetical protein